MCWTAESAKTNKKGNLVLYTIATVQILLPPVFYNISMTVNSSYICYLLTIPSIIGRKAFVNLGIPNFYFYHKPHGIFWCATAICRY